jgi:hypothetical protein
MKFVTHRTSLLFCGALVGGLFTASCARTEPVVETGAITLPANAPQLKTKVVSTPVSSSRSWTTALSPNPRGGWNFITQYWQHGSPKAPEYVVMDLQSGKSTVTTGKSGYAGSIYQWDTQAQAANGRIFFPESGCTVAYYDPKDEMVHEIGQVADPKIHSMIYRWAFGSDGKLYGGTQSSGKNPPVIVQIDPETLEHRIVGKVGIDRNSPNYAYSLSVDPTPSEGAPLGWVYAAVGQNPWELVALNAATGEQKVLWKATDAWIDGFNYFPVGIRTGLVTNMSGPVNQRKKDFFWLADGQMFPCDLSKGYTPTDIPFKPRNLLPVRDVGAPAGAPELDLSQISADQDGVGRVFWRPAGSQEEFKEVRCKVTNMTPVDVESLVTLPDNTLLGNAVQYQGFFRYNPKTEKATFYGAHGPSRGPRTVVGDKVYICGYPKGMLYVYDPKQPWTSNRRTESLAAAGKMDEAALATLNPRKLGNFRDADAHYAYFLIPSKNGRLYFGGRRERDGVGGAVGWYDPKTNTFAGHHKDLSFLTPRGMVVLDDMQRIVYSGELGSDPAQPDKKPAEAQIVVYDMELKELERITIKPGMKNTGLLLNGAKPGEFIGISEDEGVLYRYDLKNKKLLDWKTLPTGGIGNNSFVRGKDGMWWGVMGGHLVRLDPATLEIKSFGRIENPPGLLSWVGDELFGVRGAEVIKIELPAKNLP